MYHCSDYIDDEKEKLRTAYIIFSGFIIFFFVSEHQYFIADEFVATECDFQMSRICGLNRISIAKKNQKYFLMLSSMSVVC